MYCGVLFVFGVLRIDVLLCVMLPQLRAYCMVRIAEVSHGEWSTVMWAYCIVWWWYVMWCWVVWWDVLCFSEMCCAGIYLVFSAMLYCVLYCSEISHWWCCWRLCELYRGWKCHVIYCAVLWSKFLYCVLCLVCDVVLSGDVCWNVIWLDLYTGECMCVWIV